MAVTDPDDVFFWNDGLINWKRMLTCERFYEFCEDENIMIISCSEIINIINYFKIMIE